ncbi:MAG TPA: ATP-binding protein [Nodosilinea sp.]|nr:ATP-binding protein [Nodosilinea sp.]
MVAAKQSRHLSLLSTHVHQSPVALPIAQSASPQEELCLALQQLHVTQKALDLAKQKLAIASQRLKQEQQQLQSAQEKIAEQTTVLSQLEHQFERDQRLERVGALASGVVHDLNNVFAPILTIAQVLRLKQPALDARSQEMLKILEDSARRGSDMVKQILISTQTSERKRSLVQISPLLQDLITLLRHTFPASIGLRPNIADPALGPVLANSTDLHQILMNLCVNARDAMPTGGTLTISAENCTVDEAVAQQTPDAHVGDYVVVTIADTGIGIAPDLRDRIFEPFFTTKPADQGTGLGLATVLNIVQSYGGFIQIASELGQGTEVKVYLPCVAATEPRGSEPDANP